MTRPRWLGRVEILIFFMCATGMALTGYYVFGPRAQNKMAESGKRSLGYVKPLGSDVRVKAESEQNWNTVRRDANVFRNDRVYTGQASAAKVNLKAGQQITVEPNSLVVIDDKGEKSLIDLNMGSFIGELKKGARLLVRVKGQPTEVNSDGATLRLQANDDKSLRIVVLNGSAKVKNVLGKEIKLLSSNEEATVHAEKVEVKSFPIALQSPTPGATLWDEGKKSEFSWSNPNPHSKVVIQVSTDPDFKTIAYSTETDREKAQFKLKPGIYFWRVSTLAGATQRSPTSSFAYNALVPPVVAKNATVDVEANSQGMVKNPIYFSWYDTMASDDYEVQVSYDPTFSQVEKSKTVSRTEAWLDGLELGTYYWRVISKSEGRLDLSSESGKVSFFSKDASLPLAENIQSEKREPAREDSAPTESAKVMVQDSPHEASPIKKYSASANQPTAPHQRESTPEPQAVTAMEFPEKPAVEAPPPAPSTDLDNSNSRWSVGAFYGFKGLQIQQKNTLGSAKVSVLLPSYFGINSRFIYKEWEAWFLFDSYKLKYEAASASGEKQLSSLQLGGAWRMFWGGIQMEELPLFKNNGGSVDMTKQSFLFASVGTKHNWKLETETPTSLRLLTRISYPLAVSTDNVTIEASRPSGFGAGGTLELRRQLYATPNRKLYLVWPISIDYLSLSQNINWSPSSGTVDSEFISTSTALGLQLDF